MRLIDANALVDKFWQEECRTQTRRDFVAMVNYAPTVDAVEVVHGRWITEYWKSGYIKRCCCSECGEPPKDAYKPDNYCPNCGAKMDGEL